MRERGEGMEGSGLGARLGMREGASLLGSQAFTTSSLLLLAVCKYEGARPGDMM